MHFFTPSTADGVVTSIRFTAPGQFECAARFDVDEPFRQRLESGSSVVFAARSRICRLGISITPTTPPARAASAVELHLTGRTTIPAYALEPLLQHCLVPGTSIGRLIACDPLLRCGSDEIHRAMEARALLLPRGCSLQADGTVEFPPQFCVYGFPSNLSRDQLFTVLNRNDGKELLNTLQVRRGVDAFTLMPGEGLVTSCAMFLHEHYLVLDTEPGTTAAHLSARILDPVETRLSKVFLEFENTTEGIVVNPRARARIYRADSREYVGGSVFNLGTLPASQPARAAFEDIEGLFHMARARSGGRPARVVYAPSDGRLPLQKIISALESEAGPAGGVYHVAQSEPRRTLTAMHGKTGSPATGNPLPSDRPIMLFSEYFPDAVEYPDLLNRAAVGSLKALIFRETSPERGPFFSERDHVRMADLADLGVEIYWSNPLFGHVAKLTHKERRAFFVPEDRVEPFQDSLVTAVYGSVMELDDMEQDRLSGLVTRLRREFGKSLAMLTGGGGGVMRHVSEVGRSLGLMVGCNYLEGPNQHLDAHVGFYQTFQTGSRHMRQRWFEVARFHLFCIGGIGTLEEIGLTLTDIKLGLLHHEPIVLFGREATDLYWRDLMNQLARMVESGRAPRWITDNILVTDNPDEAIAFYRRVLELA